ncbi:hypothetical protein [Brachybacterium sp.]|uniref:hypothetical protein n=1 Tax=Brachybacterium sp. TaxID=1891286 RepID=UPI002ED4235D
MAGDDVTVVVNGIRVRRDEAAALGIKLPGVAAPAPETAADEDEKTEDKPAARKARTPANKQRRTVANK